MVTIIANMQQLEPIVYDILEQVGVRRANNSALMDTYITIQELIVEAFDQDNLATNYLSVYGMDWIVLTIMY